MQTDGPLLIDEQAAAVPIDDRERVGWAAGQQVFVSSLIGDMRAERDSVRQAIVRVGATPVMFEEDLGAQDIPAEQAYLAGVRRSDIYVGLFGSRYGQRRGDGYSATEAEFREAERRGLRLCLFVNGLDGGDMDGGQRDLIAGAQHRYTTSPWSTAEDLGRRVEQRLIALAAEALAPWVRVGRTIFRARHIRSTGTEIVIQSDIRSGQVYAELQSMREQVANDVRFASTWDARRVQVTGMTTESTTVAQRKVTITLTDRGRPNQSSGRMSINNMSADELGRRALADGLFGTNDLPRDWIYRPVDPLLGIRGRGLADAVARPVAHLLLAEHLLTSEEAATVGEFRVGPSRAGRRQLRLTWTPKRQYVNSPDPAPLTIEGEVGDI